MTVQYYSPPALIKNLCCNYDNSTGGCLLLDRGEVVKCPQKQSPNLVCRYFRDVLLESPEGRALKAKIMGDDHIKTCEGCGQLFRAVADSARYCARCSRKLHNMEA